MHDLLTNYSMSEIVIFFIAFAVAFKEVIEFLDWLKKRKDSLIDNEENKKKILKAISEIESIKQTLDILIQSDKDDIKSWITEKHHYYVYEKRYIDDYSLDCIEKRFKHYVDEGGNSFIEDLMNEIRALPKTHIEK